MTTTFANAPAPDELLLTAREALKHVLRQTDADHDYTILMVMNAMGIAARAMRAQAVPPAHADMTEDAFKHWVREAGHADIIGEDLIAGLRSHIQGKLAVSNPRFRPEGSRDKT